MTPRNHRRAIVAFFVYVAALLSLPSPTPALAEDIDIFSINPNIAGQRPNVLIMLDSSANWAATDTVAGGKKFTHVSAAMASTIGGLTDQFNVGLMMYAETGGGNDNIDGGVMRTGVRQMSAANRPKLVDFFNSVDGDFDKSNNTSMGLAFHEAYLYFTGQTGISGIGKEKRDFNGNTWPTSGSQAGAPAAQKAASSSPTGLWALSPNALTNSSSTVYNSPMTDACQKNFIIYIANGTVTDPNSANSDATTKLAAIGGAGATETILFTQNTGDQGNITDEWTRYLANNDIRPDATNPTFPGKQTIVTYTVEVNPVTNTQGLNNTELLKSMANQGKGKYFGVTSAGGGAAIADALNQIFAEILAVNSVFASSTLPVSVNVRGTFLNQVYMGVFRPDANSSPRWPGNVKQYTLAETGGNVFLVDKNGQAIENSTTGFISPSAVSFWTVASTFWDNIYYPDTVAQPPLAATTSDSPDGEFVEKGGAAQHLRTVHATDVTTRKLYTCVSGGTPDCTSGSDLSSGGYEFVTSNTNITGALLGITGVMTVSALTRSGDTVTATATAHGFTNGQSVTIAGANETNYNVATNIVLVDANTFTYTITEQPVSPATAASGQTLTAAKGTGAQSVTSVTLSGSTAAATTPVAHGLADGATVTISGATQSEYNGTYTITLIDATNFSYTITTGPANPTTLGNISVTRSDSSTAASAISSMTRSGTTVSVGTSGNVFTGALTCSSVTITGAVPANYNVTSRTPCTKVGNKALTFDFLSTELTPTSPAGGAITADASVARTISSMTRPTGSGTVTVTTSVAHPFLNGDTIAISGASDSLYNGNKVIAGVTATTFTFTLTPQPATPATGSITATGSGGINKDSLINWVRGENVLVDDNPTPTATRVRGYLHGDVLHSRPAVINYNRAGQPANRDLVVYYGSNAGVVHAVKGGQNDLDGDEKWGFIPTEFYTGFARLYAETPIISTNNTRTYFADGPISLDAVFIPDTSVTPPIDRLEGVGARAQIYIGMRRGGRFYYSLDVTNPDAPVYKWKITNTGDFAELGQSWSEPKVVKVRLTTCPGTADADGNCKVLVFGAGYDAAANDPIAQGTATMGRGIFVVDAVTGTLIWHASPDAVTPSVGVHKQVSGMDFAIPADLAVINSDLDVQNLADRIYAADTGGNIWRVNISDPDPANWGVGKVAALGGSGADARKFLFAPDVVAFDSFTDSILIGSGDREKPFDTTIANRYYMIKDSHGINDLPASPAATESDLVDLTSNTLQDPAATQAQLDTIRADLAAGRGWLIRLGTGEKTVTGATTLGGTTIFATNTPASVSTPGTCTGSLGLALIYAVDFREATATIDFNGDGVLSGTERNIERPGGGFPPTAIPFATQIGDNYFEGAITGTQVVQPPTSPIGQRYRVFWNLSVDN